MFNFKSYVEAKSIDEALSYVTENPNAQIIAGGTDILIKTRELKEGYEGRDLVGITRIKELKEIKIEEEGILVGACATFTQIERSQVVLKHLPSLSVAVGTVGGPQVRNSGTIGGNICNGATSADSASTLFAMNAILIIKSKNGTKELPIKEFYLGPGRVKLEKGEILTAIKITKENYEGYRGHYIKFAQRNAMDIATLGCSVMVKIRDNKIEELHIAFGVAGPTPLRAASAEEFAKGLEITEDNLKAIGEKCLEASRARDSWRASKQFREGLICELPQRAIQVALGGAIK